jgi:transcriptional regulator with XRE-family HTH domain
MEPGPALDRPYDERLAVQSTQAVTDRGTLRASRRLPGLRQWRMLAGLTQEQLAHAAGLARETLTRIEHQQRGARAATIRGLAEALLVAPSMLTGSSDLDASIEEPLRTCTDCGALRPARAFSPIAGTPYAYGCCRVCRNRRKRERYYSTPDILAAERARSRRNKQLRKYRAGSQGDPPESEPMHA